VRGEPSAPASFELVRVGRQQLWRWGTGGDVPTGVQLGEFHPRSEVRPLPLLVLFGEGSGPILLTLSVTGELLCFNSYSSCALVWCLLGVRKNGLFMDGRWLCGSFGCDLPGL
jgi:hypothetical protein